MSNHKQPLPGKIDGCGRCTDCTKPCDITGSSCAADAIEAQCVPAGLTLAAIGHKHFGNPIPQAWYAAAKELLASAPPAPQASVVQQEPVAYVCPTGRAAADGSMEDGPEYLEWADEASDYEKRVGTPLYTHPAQQAKTQPLLSSEIWSNDAIMEVNADAQLPYELIERFVLAIEAAHGVKGS